MADCLDYIQQFINGIGSKTTPTQQAALFRNIQRAIYEKGDIKDFVQNVWQTNQGREADVALDLLGVQHINDIFEFNDAGILVDDNEIQWGQLSRFTGRFLNNLKTTKNLGVLQGAIDGLKNNKGVSLSQYVGVFAGLEMAQDNKNAFGGLLLASLFDLKNQVETGTLGDNVTQSNILNDMYAVTAGLEFNHVFKKDVSADNGLQDGVSRKRITKKHLGKFDREIIKTPQYNTVQQIKSLIMNDGIRNVYKDALSSYNENEDWDIDAAEFGNVLKGKLDTFFSSLDVGSDIKEGLSTIFTLVGNRYLKTFNISPTNMYNIAFEYLTNMTSANEYVADNVASLVAGVTTETTQHGLYQLLGLRRARNLMQSNGVGLNLLSEAGRADTVKRMITNPDIFKQTFGSLGNDISEIGTLQKQYINKPNNFELKTSMQLALESVLELEAVAVNSLLHRSVDGVSDLFFDITKTEEIENINAENADIAVRDVPHNPLLVWITNKLVNANESEIENGLFSSDEMMSKIWNSLNLESKNEIKNRMTYMLKGIRQITDDFNNPADPKALQEVADGYNKFGYKFDGTISTEALSDADNKALHDKIMFTSLASATIISDLLANSQNLINQDANNILGNHRSATPDSVIRRLTEQSVKEDSATISLIQNQETEHINFINDLQNKHIRPFADFLTEKSNLKNIIGKKAENINFADTNRFYIDKNKYVELSLGQIAYFIAGNDLNKNIISKRVGFDFNIDENQYDLNSLMQKIADTVYDDDVQVEIKEKTSGIFNGLFPMYAQASYEKKVGMSVNPLIENFVPVMIDQADAKDAHNSDVLSIAHRMSSELAQNLNSTTFDTNLVNVINRYAGQVSKQYHMYPVGRAFINALDHLQVSMVSNADKTIEAKYNLPLMTETLADIKNTVMNVTENITAREDALLTKIMDKDGRTLSRMTNAMLMGFATGLRTWSSLAYTKAYMKNGESLIQGIVGKIDDKARFNGLWQQAKNLINVSDVGATDVQNIQQTKNVLGINKFIDKFGATPLSFLSWSHQSVHKVLMKSVYLNSIKQNPQIDDKVILQRFQHIASRTQPAPSNITKPYVMTKPVFSTQTTLVNQASKILNMVHNGIADEWRLGNKANAIKTAGAVATGSLLYATLGLFSPFKMLGISAGGVPYMMLSMTGAFTRSLSPVVLGSRGATGGANVNTTLGNMQSHIDFAALTRSLFVADDPVRFTILLATAFRRVLPFVAGHVGSRDRAATDVTVGDILKTVVKSSEEDSAGQVGTFTTRDQQTVGEQVLFVKKPLIRKNKNKPVEPSKTVVGQKPLEF